MLSTYSNTIPLHIFALEIRIQRDFTPYIVITKFLFSLSSFFGRIHLILTFIYLHLNQTPHLTPIFLLISYNSYNNSISPPEKALSLNPFYIIIIIIKNNTLRLHHPTKAGFYLKI